MIAIIGLAFRFPGGLNTRRTLWQALAGERDLIRQPPETRRHDLEVKDQTYPLAAGYLEKVDCFDAGFFGIKGIEATYMDPQQRLLLETVWHALEDAGQPVSRLKGSGTAVFSGCQACDYLEVAGRQAAEVNAYWNAGMNTSLLANRISWQFDFTGPSLSLNTACSSGLETVVQAVQALEQGRCNLAVAAAVNLILSPSITISAARAGMLSPDGRCKTFDRSANGFVRGEGVAALVLKPLAQAQADGNPVYAIIRSAHSAHGGRARSLTSPNLNRQRDLLLRAYGAAGCDPSRISYIEAHGTGTILGDSVETQALKAAFGQGAPGQRIGLGSIKTNLGHLESAAGLAGVIKLCLAFAQGALPRTLHFQELNPLIDFAGTPFYVVDQYQAWQDARPRQAGISSFGFGGAMAHAVLESPPPVPPSACEPGRGLFLLSAKDPDALRRYAVAILHFMAEETPPPLTDLIRTYYLGREAMTERLAVPAKDAATLAKGLRAFLDNEARGHLWFSAAPKKLVAAPTEAAGPNEAADLWLQGFKPMWPGLTQGRHIPAPVYPFAKKPYWIGA